MIRRLPLVIAAFIATTIAAYAVLVATRWLRVTRLKVGLPALPDAWSGLRIALLTDFHAGGRRVSLDMLRRAKRETLAFDPDLVVLGGDFFDEGRRVDVGDLYTCWPPGLPVVAVTGNHDYRGGPEFVLGLIEELEAVGITFLQNEAISLRIRGRTTWVAGVNDPHSRCDDVGRALAPVPLDEPALLLVSHSPSAAVDLPESGARLFVAGHTHGGQIRLLPSGRIPFIQQIRRLQGLRPQPVLPFIRGQHWFRGALVIVSDGLGQSTLGMRFRTRPELVLLELEDAPLDGPPCDDARRYVTYQGKESRLLRWLT